MRGIAVMAAAAVLAIHSPLVAQSAPATKAAVDTKDRLPDSEMQRLVSSPMTILRNKGLAAGEAAFAALLDGSRNGRGVESLQTADLLTSFGVMLYQEKLDTGDEGLGRASLKYLAAAIPAYKAAFGPGHPEVAVALSSYADAAWELAPGKNPPDSVGTAFAEALEIRLKTLSPDSSEIRGNRVRLAQFKALRSRQNPALANEAEVLFREALPGAGSEPDPMMSAAAIHQSLARLYAETGKPDMAADEALDALNLGKDWPILGRCILLVVQVDKVADTLEKKGSNSQANRVRKGIEGSGCEIEASPDPHKG